MTNQTNTVPVDFAIENDRDNGVTYYTPLTIAAYDWCHGTSVPATNPGMKSVLQFGRSFMFKSASDRATKLRGFLKGQGFALSVTTVR